MRIGTCISKKGKLEEGFLRVSYQSKTAKLPIKIIEGRENGSAAFISAGMHGDELNGINIVSSFINKVNPKNIRGTLIIVPILNPIGFHYGERKIRYDNKDLNRCFGKDGSGFSNKIASTFFKEVVSVSDFGLDFHDSNKKYILLPHTRIFEKEYKDVNELSRIFGTEIVMKRKPNRGMLALEARRLAKVPVLTIEIGGGMSLSPSYINEGIRGLNNVLVHNNFIEGNVILPKTQFILSDRKGYVSRIEGILSINKKLGNVVEREEEVGDVFNPVNEKRVGLKARNPGVLFSIKANAHIKANERAFSMLHFKRERGKIRAMEGQQVLNREGGEVSISEIGVFNKAVDVMSKHSREFFEALLRQ